MKVIPKALAALAGQVLACIEDPEVIQIKMRGIFPARINACVA
jgi:hypothetical protein